MKSLIVLLFLLAGLPLWATIDAGGVVIAASPAGIFQEGELLRFTLKPEAGNNVRYTIRDWNGSKVAEGGWPVEGLTLSELPRGYYQIFLAGDKSFTNYASFGVVAKIPKRPANSDMYFALDSAQSWCGVGRPHNVRFPKNGFKLISEAARRSGVAWVRDRLTWRDMQPTLNEFRNYQYIPNGWLLGETGIKIANTYHDAPKWARRNSKDLPDDLRGTYRFAEKVAKAAKGCTEAWEFWNEEDAGFTVESAWDYAACLKAASLGFQKGNPKARILNGSFCKYPLRNYTQTVMDNDAAFYFDTFNFHTYDPIRNYPTIIVGLRKFLERNRVPDMPIWLTETGTNAPGMATEQSYYPKLKRYSHTQEIVVAEFIPKSQVIFQNLGVERNFFFVLSPYNEGAKDWGLLRKDYTAAAGYFAFANMVAELGKARILGELQLGDDVKAYLYRQPDGSQSIVIWTLSDVDTENNEDVDVSRSKVGEKEVHLNQPDGNYTVRNLFGTPDQAVARNGQLPLAIDRYPRYVHGLAGLKADIPAVFPGVSAKRETQADRTVVLRCDLSEDFTVNSNRSSADLKNESGKLTLFVCNLSDVEKKGTITVSGGRASGLPSEITIPPMGELQLPIDFTPEIPAEKFNGKMEFGGTFNGKAITRLSVPIFLFNRSVAAGFKRELKAIYNPERWRNNSSGTMRSEYDKKEKAIRFDVEFPAFVDRWIYPEFILKGNESLHGAKGVEFEIKTTPSMPKESVFMVVMDQKSEHDKSVLIRFPMPSAEWEKRIITFDEFVERPETVKMIRLGINPRVNKQSYWIRNLQIIYGNKESEK